MNPALSRLRNYFFSDEDFAAFRNSNDVRVFNGRRGQAGRVEIYDQAGARLSQAYAHNTGQTRRRKLPFMIEKLSNDRDGVEFIERLDESTASERIYLARYLDATGGELRVSHGHDWFLTERVRAALRLAFGRPLFAGVPPGGAFAPRTVHARAVDLVFIAMAPRLTLAFATLH